MPRLISLQLEDWEVNTILAIVEEDTRGSKKRTCDSLEESNVPNSKRSRKVTGLFLCQIQIYLFLVQSPLKERGVMYLLINKTQLDFGKI